MTPRFLRQVLVLLCLSAVVPVHAQTGPIAWWKLDEGTGTTTADASGSGNNGTLGNSPTWVSGRVGPGALSFGGTTSYVSVTNSGNLNNLYQTGMTVTAWIKPVSAGGGGRGRAWLLRVKDDYNHAGLERRMQLTAGEATMPDVLIDTVFFGICILVGAFVALWPVTFFRAITFGRFDQQKVAASLLRIVQILAAGTAVSFAIRLVTDLFERTR